MIEARVVSVFRNGAIAIDAGEDKGVKDGQQYMLEHGPIEIPTADKSDRLGHLDCAPVEYRVVLVREAFSVLAPAYVPEAVSVGDVVRERGSLRRFTPAQTMFIR